MPNRMPSPKKSSSRLDTKPDSLRRSFLAVLVLPFLAGAVLLFPGCMAVEESQAQLDFPTGPDYLPVVTREATVWPQKVLVLPVSGHVRDETRAEFEREFLAALRARIPWTIFLYEGADSTSADLTVTAEAALTRAKTLGADSILQIDLPSEQIYSPLRVEAEIEMQAVSDGHTFYRLTADYDGRDKTVANSARRYYQKQIENRGLPNKSESILSDRQEFLRFVGAYTGRLVADSFVVAANQKSAKPEVVGPPSAVPPPHQDFQESPIQPAKDK